VVLPASHKVPRVSWYSGFRPVSLLFAYGTFTLYGFSFPAAYSAKLQESLRRSSTPLYFRILVWASPLSLATTYGITFVFFSCGYLDVSVPRVSLAYTMDSCMRTCFSITGGFPHSDIRVSIAICASSRLFAAYRVLLRLLVPRHSPYALSSLTNLLRIRDSLRITLSLAHFGTHVSQIRSAPSFRMFLVLLASNESPSEVVNNFVGSHFISFRRLMFSNPKHNVYFNTSLPLI
jgi:hypothetical protein